MSLVYLFWFFKEVYKSGLESDARYHPLTVLKRKKQILLSDSTWERIRSEAIDHAFRDEWNSDVLKWEGRNMLDSDCPAYLTEEEWQKLVSNLTKVMAKLIDSEVKSARASWRTDTLGLLLKVKRPRHFAEREWNETVESLRNNYVACLVDSQRWRQTSEIADVVRGERPGFLTEEDWKKCKHDVGELYYARLAAEVAIFPEPMDRLAQRDLSVLSDEQVRAIREFAYHRQMANLPNVITSYGAEEFLKRPRPKWMAEEDYASLRDAAERYQGLVADKRQYDSLMKAAQNLLAGIELSSNPPPAVSAEEWAKVKAVEKKVLVSARENSRRSAELDEERSDLEKLKSKVLRQLDVLDRFLQDPDVADRIEPYGGLRARQPR